MKKVCQKRLVGLMVTQQSYKNKKGGTLPAFFI
jgi:hypothetical protein